MAELNEILSRTLTIERTLKAPVELVWQAWSQPEHIVNWWGPPGMETQVEAHEFKVGGQWRYIMQMPDGSEFVAEGIYSEIIEMQKIISSADFKPMTEGVEIQAIFEAAGNETKFIFNCVHPTAEYARQQEEMGFYNGWGSVFDRLEELLASA